MASKGKLIVCSQCHRLAKLCARGLCNTCYDKDVKSRKIRACKNCGQVKPHHSDGLCNSCYQRIKYNANPERKREWKRNDRKKKRDWYISKDRARCATPQRKAYAQARHQKYYVKNRDKLLAYQRQYKDSFPDKINHWSQKRIARIAGLPHDLTEEQWSAILEQHHYSCHYCGASNVKLQREHKIPVSRGGGYTADNIVPACPTCNMRKHTRTDSEFKEFLKKFPR